jgi:hypothetical protein
MQHDRRGEGSAASPLRTTAHPPHTGFAKRVGTSVPETATQASPEGHPGDELDAARGGPVRPDLGFGSIVALHYSWTTLYQIH